MISGREFVQTYAKKGYVAWEAAALELARQGQLTPWPWVDLPLTLPGTDDTAIVKVSSDVLSVGPFEDLVRLPLTPSAAQSILNLSGSLMTTPWLEYQIWRAAPAKLQPIRSGEMRQINKGADLVQYADHSRHIDQQLRQLTVVPGTLTSGIKKGIVVSNMMRAGKVIIFGWYIHYLVDKNGRLTDQPARDIFEDHRALDAVNRQPIQPESDAHGDFYVDYSHGVRAVAPYCTVRGQTMATIDLYRDPTFARFVSHNGPVRIPRYPSKVPPALPPPAITGPLTDLFDYGHDPGPFFRPPTPGVAELGLQALAWNASTGRLLALPRRHLHQPRLIRGRGQW